MTTRNEPQIFHSSQGGEAHFDDPRNAKLEISFGTIERSNDEVDDTEMEALLVRISEVQPLLFFLNFPHEFFSFFILRGHDVTDAKVC